MNINTELFEKRYQEIKSQNKDEEFLDEKIKGIKMFINKKPNNVLFDFKIEPDNIYIGSD